MKSFYPLVLIALAIGAWQFLPRQPTVEINIGEPKKTAPTKKILADKTPLWEHAAQAIKDQTGNWKLPEIAMPKIELPEIVVEEWPGSMAANKTARVTSGAQLSHYETMLCNLANRERKAKGLKPLKISPALADVARAHSKEMAQKAYFDHQSPDPKRRTVMDRYKLKFKETPRLVAENIYKLEGPSFYKLGEKDFRRAHTGWMNSPGHRENILRDSPAGGPTEIGVGIVVRNGSFWATQNFARP